MDRTQPPPPRKSTTLRQLVDLIVGDIVKSRGGSDEVRDVLVDVAIAHKYYGLHGGSTPGSRASLTELELDRLLAGLDSKDAAARYRDLYVEARACREAELSGRVPSFHRMDLYKPTRGFGWVGNVVALSHERGLDYRPPDSKNVNQQIDALVHRVRGESGDVAAMDAAYSLLEAHEAHERSGRASTARDRAHVKLLLLYQVIDLAAQIGARGHLRFLRGRVETALRDLAPSSDAAGIARRMMSYCSAQILCVSPPRHPGARYYRKLKEETDGAVSAFDRAKVSAEAAHNFSPLVAGWAGAHFQRVAAALGAAPTRAAFDRLLNEHDDVAGGLVARFPSRFSFSLFADCRDRGDFSNPYVAEILALRLLLPADDEDAFAKRPNGLYPPDDRLSEAVAALDAGLKSSLFDDKAHDAIKAEIILWKMVLTLSAFAAARSGRDRLAYLEARRIARALMGPLGMLGQLDRIEAFQQVNAGLAD